MANVDHRAPMNYFFALVLDPSGFGLIFDTFRNTEAGHVHKVPRP